MDVLSHTTKVMQKVFVLRTTFFFSKRISHKRRRHRSRCIMGGTVIFCNKNIWLLLCCTFYNTTYFFKVNSLSKNFDERPHRMSRSCCGLNDPFCYVHSSRLSLLFSRPDNPQKIAPSRGAILTPSNMRFLGPTRVSYPNSISTIQPFLHSSPVCPTHRQTDHATCDICLNRPMQCMRFRLIILHYL